MKVKVQALDSSDKGEIELSDSIFGVKPRKDILQRMVVSQLATRRSGTHKSKSRGEIVGSTKKIMRQKGSGGARHGTRKVNIFRGGGTAHGPRPRDYAFSLPKKVRALALRSALSDRALGNNLLVLEKAESLDGKTKTLNAQLKKLNLANALIVDGSFQKEFALSARNIPNIHLLPSEGLNVYDIIRYDTLVLTQAAVAKIEERLK